MDDVTRRSLSRLLIHVVWATRGRRRILPAHLDTDLAAIIGRKASTVGCELLVAGIAPDHLHVLLHLSACIALADAVQRLKGASAHDINHRFSVTKRIAWQAGYWAESFGPADFDPLARYVSSQRLHHDESHPAEQWQAASNEER